VGEKFQAKPLLTLDAIYDFVGGLSTVSQVDLTRGIDLVHNVAREAENNAGAIINLTHTLVSGGTGADAFATIEVGQIFDGTIGGSMNEVLAALGRRVETTDVYLLACGAQLGAGAANIVTVVMGYRPPNNGRFRSTAGQAPFLLLNGNLELANVESVAGGLSPFVFASAGENLNIRHVSTVEFPERCETIFVRVTDDAVGTLSVTFFETFAFVPIGADPRVA